MSNYCEETAQAAFGIAYANSAAVRLAMAARSGNDEIRIDVLRDTLDEYLRIVERIRFALATVDRRLLASRKEAAE